MRIFRRNLYKNTLPDKAEEWDPEQEEAEEEFEEAFEDGVEEREYWEEYEPEEYLEEYEAKEEEIEEDPQEYAEEEETSEEEEYVGTADSEYEESEDGTLYAETADVEEEYAEEEYPEGGYEEEEYTEAAEAYVEESIEQEQEEEVYSEENLEEEQYIEEEDGSEEILQDDSAEEYAEEAEETPARKVRRKSFPLKGVDIAMIAAAAAMIAIGGLVLWVFIGRESHKKDPAETFASVGNGLKKIELIGDIGITKAADAKLQELENARLLAEAEAEEEARRQREAEQNKDYNENNEIKKVSVKMETVSVLKDLKLKFSNTGSGKLVSNVPFTVKVTKPDGTSETWIDEDMDGIIYKKNMTAGTYAVAAAGLTSERYSGYSVPTDSRKVEVKGEIEYTQVDVKNEIKTEAQVNAAKEDTNTAAGNKTVESVLEDTVAWVESTVIYSSYREINKSDVKEPEVIIGSTGAQWSFGTQASSASNSQTVSGNEAPAVIPIKYSFSANKTSETIVTEGIFAITVNMEGSKNEAPVIAVSNQDIVSVTVSGSPGVTTGANGQVTAVYTLNVTGLAAGETVIVLKHPEKEDLSAACSVKVLLNPKNDTTSKLVDKSGRQLYILKDNTYVEAVYADYYTSSSFFIKGEPAYTGWQTLDGYVYFFDVNGNKVIGRQVIQGAVYNFDDAGRMLTDSGVMGIDVSRWNGTIDWEAVKNSGVTYVIIRCGYRGKDQGVLVEDSKYAANIKGALSAGLKVGIYFFSQALDEVEALEEASMVLELVKGYQITYPIFIDVESSGGRGDGLNKEQLTAVCKTFCETIKNGGYSSGIYANKTWLTERLDMSALNAYKVWLAQYAAQPTYAGRYDMWQYKSTGKVTGINGDVDMNISYLSY